MSRRAPKGVFSLVLVFAIASFVAGCSHIKIVSAKCAGQSFEVKEIVTMKKDKQIIAWSSDAKELKINWKGTNPYLQKRCVRRGRKLRGSRAVRDYGTYKYTIKGTCNGAPAEKDPQVEIIDY